MSKKNIILVTGGAGFVGSNMIDNSIRTKLKNLSNLMKGPG